MADKQPAKWNITDYTGTLTDEQRRALCRKGGQVSAEVRRKKKLMRESIRMVLEAPVIDDAIRERLEELGLDSTVQDAIMLAVSGKAQRGDVEAARFLRDTVGEKPVEGLRVGVCDAEQLETMDFSRLTNAQLAALAAEE